MTDPAWSAETKAIVERDERDFRHIGLVDSADALAAALARIEELEGALRKIANDELDPVYTEYGVSYTEALVQCARAALKDHP